MVLHFVQPPDQIYGFNNLNTILECLKEKESLPLYMQTYLKKSHEMIDNFKKQFDTDDESERGRSERQDRWFKSILGLSIINTDPRIIRYIIKNCSKQYLVVIIDNAVNVVKILEYIKNKHTKLNNKKKDGISMDPTYDVRSKVESLQNKLKEDFENKHFDGIIECVNKHKKSHSLESRIAILVKNKNAMLKTDSNIDVHHLLSLIIAFIKSFMDKRFLQFVIDNCSEEYVLLYASVAHNHYKVLNKTLSKLRGNK